MFKDKALFLPSSLIKNDDPSKQLKLASGSASLAVHSKGTTQYIAGNGHMFELKNCLYVPDLACNLLAGGLLRQQGVDECRNPDDPDCFSLVLKNVALFNGTLASNNLMSHWTKVLQADV
ncbi:hypothetical protein CROQUDRAFT_87100 [Cronartium quercuum f. sp. fusiforme G11]|uniref:Retrovirus-related Pol polyprotein from transposon TNT 1-94-like beta-barrel domain-containing protein n=1 Tax=Cronartium quercuum f. sp. fusiforme G11 TaxID=708437 RepID=A0A9P6NQ36_9BASI|nr:hypothetical protein CROQUDRAFT_87100 [Cronartium quercuum f. sp. fusiforme G11]